MRPAVLALPLAVALLVAGCVATPAPGGQSTSVVEETTDHDTTTRQVTTDRTTTTNPESATTEYVVRPGPVPEDVASLTVTFRVVFAERTERFGRCFPEVLRGPYKPTITPVGTPTEDCRRSEPVTVDLTTVDGNRSLGTFDVPESVGGHALVVTAVTATDENGTDVEDIRGTGGAVLLRESERPAGGYRATVGVEPAPDGASYDYSLVTEAKALCPC